MLFETEIKTALINAGLSEELYDQIEVKNVDEIPGAIEQLKSDMDKIKSLTNEEFYAAIKHAGLEDAYKRVLKSDTDRVLTKAIKTHDEKLKKAAEEEKRKKLGDEEKNQMSQEQKDIAALKETITALNESIEGFKISFTAKDMETKIRNELKKAGLNEEFAPYVKSEDPDKIADAVSEFKQKLDAHQQSIIDKKLESGELAPVKSGNAGMTLDESKIANYAKSLTGKGTVKNPDFPGKITSESEITKE